MCPFHDPSGGGSSGGGGSCNCSLQQAYNKIPSGVIVETDAGGPLDFQRPPGDDTGLIVRAPTGANQDIAEEWIAHGVVFSEGPPVATTTDLVLTAFATSDVSTSDVLGKTRYEFSEGSIGTFLRQCFLDGFLSIINPIPTTNPDPLHKVGEIMEARYWDGAADQPTRVACILDPQNIPNLSDSWLRWWFRVDNRGGGGAAIERMRLVAQVPELGHMCLQSARRDAGGVYSLQKLTKLIPTAVATAGPYAAVANDLVRADPTLGSFAVDLPASANSEAGDMITVKVQSASGNTVTVTPNGADTIDGVNAGTVLNAHQSLTLVFDGGTDWMVIT
jgi:hypothetical protein